jgi:hypothetical protein
MAGQRPSEADRLRQSRLIFQRALREGTTMAEARDAETRARWADADRRLAARCGTQAPAEPGDRPTLWYQREDL